LSSPTCKKRSATPPKPCASASYRSLGEVLIDNALSPAIGEELKGAGHDAVHVRELAMQAASDEEIFDHAAEDDRIVVSADTDFGTLLAIRRQTAPSVILFRHGSQRRPADQAALLRANLPQLTDALEAGSIVVIEPDRIRVRALPLIP
jgi:predicted nuclease of predicted toxin-antitoxin system